MVISYVYSPQAASCKRPTPPWFKQVQKFATRAMAQYPSFYSGHVKGRRKYQEGVELLHPPGNFQSAFWRKNFVVRLEKIATFVQFINFLGKISIIWVYKNVGKFYDHNEVESGGNIALFTFIQGPNCSQI